uniref:BED-type domain-containing protein n=1 Tax=Fagus sylvatica TaxID=28930 RepID=A0A2N9EVX9_FAGSY
MNEEVDEFGESASSVSKKTKKTRCRTSTIWSEFELEPIGVDGQQKAKCKRCNRTYAAGDNETTSLLRYAKKCSKKVNDGDETVDHHRPIDQDMYRETLALAIIRHNYPFSYDILLCSIHTEVPKDVQAEAYLAIGGPRKKLKSASNLSNAEEIKTPTSRLNDLPQTTMLEMCVAAYGSGYEVPSYLTLRTKLISNLRIEVEAVQTKKRNMLESKILDDDLVYMRMNTMMTEKSNTSEGQDLEPIDLDKLNELPEYFDRKQDKDQ